MSEYSLMKDDGVAISVVVVNPQEVKSTLTSYTTYSVVGQDKQGKFEVTRRYSDFDAVRNTMVMRWPGCFVPPLPPKKLLGKGEAIFIEERRRLLELFCRTLTTFKHLWYSEEFQIFLRSTNPEVEKAIKAIPAQSNDQLIKKYDELFSNLSGKDINTTVMAKIASFNTFVKRILPMLSNFKEMAQNFIELRSRQNQLYEYFVSHMMPDYQRKCLTEYVNKIEGKLVFAEAKDEKLIELINKLKEFSMRSQFLELYYMLELEQREVQAFGELFRYKEAYENKLEDFKIKEKDLNLKYQQLMAGKQGFFKSIFKSNIQDDKREVQMELDKVKLDKESYDFICQISTVILGNFQVDRFKQQKSQKYFLTLKKIADSELELSQLKEAIFKHVLQNHNLV